MNSTGTSSEMIINKNLLDTILSLPKQARDILTAFEDCEEFFTKFYKRNRYAIDDLLDYREYKIAKMDIEFHDFVRKCAYVGWRNTFEATFLQSFEEDEIKMIYDAVNSGKIELEEIFAKFKENPNVNIMKYII